jgi:hypothetical protein
VTIEKIGGLLQHDRASFLRARKENG